MDGETADYFVERGFEINHTRTSLVRDRSIRQIRREFHYLQTYGGQWYAMKTERPSGLPTWRGPGIDDPIAAYVHAEVQGWKEDN